MKSEIWRYTRSQYESKIYGCATNLNKTIEDLIAEKSAFIIQVLPIKLTNYAGDSYVTEAIIIWK